MCFIVKTKKAKAKNDIKTYKILKEYVVPVEGHRRVYYSIYYNLKYILGECHEKIEMYPIFKYAYSICPTLGYAYIIKFGYHSYVSKAKAYEMLGYMSRGHKIVECIIPKNTHYYVNTDEGVRVSEVIKPIKIKGVYYEKI